MKLVVKSPVWEDLRAIGQRIAADNPDAADEFFSATEKTFEFLRENPGAGPLRSFSQPGIRSWRVSGFPNYLVFYLPKEGEVQVLAVLHGARNLEITLPERLS